MPEIRIHEKIFEAYTSFRRGIVVGTKMQNKGHSEELETLLKRATAEAAEGPTAPC